MKHIKLFESFNAEEKALYLIENWADSDFIKKVTGKTILNRDADYELSNTEIDYTSDSYVVGIKILEIKKEYAKDLKPFRDSFTEWAIENGFSDWTEITPDKNELPTSITFRAWMKKS